MEHHDESRDDAIIGKAFRWSLLVILMIIAVGALILFVTTRPEPKPVVTETVPFLPEAAKRVVDVPAVPFTNITKEAGVGFIHRNGATGQKLLPETMGGGVAFFDYDADGDPDLLLVGGADWPDRRGSEPQSSLALYRNEGARFVDVTREMGLAISLYGMGVATGDYDGDGRIDLFITAVGGNRLFRNEAAGFRETTAAAGVGGADDAWSSSAGFFDYDNDGDLDLFVCNYIRWSKEIDLANDFRLTGVGRAYGPPTNFEGTYNYLYRNEGGGRFRDVSAESGIQIDNPATGRPMGKALALAPIDFDGDGFIDIMVANDTVQNFCFRNLGDGTFREEGARLGMAFDRNGNATGAMGIDAAYYRNDAMLGLAIGNFANEMTSLYVTQQTQGSFADEAIGEGIGPPSRMALTFGLVFFDADLDGRLDLVQANGHLEEEINKVQAAQHYRQPAQLFWNTGIGRTFEPVTETGELTRPIVGRGVASADIDGDGDEDLVLTQIGGAPLLLRNDQGLGHNWLGVRLSNPNGNRQGLGAWVELTAGGLVQKRHMMATKSYLSQNPAHLIFGLGRSGSVERLRITWPDGAVQEVIGPAVNTTHLIVRAHD